MFVISCLDVIRLHSSNNTFYVYRNNVITKQAKDQLGSMGCLCHAIKILRKIVDSLIWTIPISVKHETARVSRI